MPENNASQTTPHWQQESLEKILLENIKENRRKRRWSIFFKLIYLAILVLFIYMLMPDKELKQGNRLKPHIALIKMDGEISSTSKVSTENVLQALNKAYNNAKVTDVILQINSPGGSPVQAADIYDQIIYLRKAYPHIKVYAICGDLCASAAYYIAASAEKIYANPASLVGSIGVLINGFGFVETLNKLGVERRLIVAGDHKGFLDPFSPLKPEDRDYAQNLINTVHQQFINAVKMGRGSRLKDSPDLFSGLVWTGSEAKNLGLIDDYGSLNTVAREVIKNINVVDYTYEPGFFEQLNKGMGALFSLPIGDLLGLHGVLK